MATQTPYDQHYYPPIPTRLTLYTRNSLIWQAIRFVVLNIKMLKIVMQSKH
jgi:hypothetical protein